MKVTIITIGDEILIGQIIDTNSAWIAQELNLIGAHIKRIVSVGDDQEDIIKALRESTSESEVTILTGGLGPTKDDITKDAIATFLQVTKVFHDPTYQRILKFFAKLERQPTAAHRQQCYLPDGAIILPNKMGTAPGMWFDYHGRAIVSIPGVPYEMKYLMEHEVIPKIAKQFVGKPIAHRTILTVGEGESKIAERLAHIEDHLPAGVKLAYLPGLGRVRLRLTAYGEDRQMVDKLLQEYGTKIEATIPELIFGYEKLTLEEAIGQLLAKKQLTMATAESCTGGLLSHQIVSVPGSSAYFMGGLIAYDNQVKIEQLQVSPQTLDQYGAVSEQTVIEMVNGALEKFGTDLAVSVSGIAGPSGGTPTKPVGTIWIAIGSKKQIRTKKIFIGKNRLTNIQYTVVQALNMIRLFVFEHFPND